MTDLRAEIETNRGGQTQRNATAVVGVSGPSVPQGEERHGAGWGGLSLDPTSVLYVSLFLVLFAFFVVLNVNSSEKAGEAEAVMASLQDVFSREGGNVQGEDQSAPDLDEVLAKALRTVLSDLPQATLLMPVSGNVLEVSVPLESFFVKHTARLTPSRELFLKSLATLATAADNQSFIIALAFDDREADQGVQRQLAALAAILGKYGIPAGKLTIIGANVEPGQVRLVLSRG